MLTVKLIPTGYEQPLEAIEPGLFVMLDASGCPVSAGIKSEYGPEFYAYNEAGEYCSSTRCVPVKVEVEDE